MATFLDISLLSGAKAIFAFLLVFCFIYGILKFTNFLKLSDGMISIISLSLGFISILSPQFVRVVEIVTPWYMIMGLALISILMVIMIFGSLGDSLPEVRKNIGAGSFKTIMIWIIVISAIIMISGISQVFLSGSESQYAINAEGERVEITNTSNGELNVDGKGTSAFIDSLFHPRMLGLMALLLISAFAVLLLGGTNK